MDKAIQRSFLQKQAIQFEAGMNSYEDICFHFSVLLKATRISLIDDTLVFYRQNRPDQISGRTDRRVFEVFAVFDKIHKNLAAWNASAEIWAILVKVQLRQFAWLLEDRVQLHHRQEFMAQVARQFQGIPEDGFGNFARQAHPNELGKLLCMRRNWRRAYDVIAARRGPLFALLSVTLHLGRPGALKYACREGMTRLRQSLGRTIRHWLKSRLI